MVGEIIGQAGASLHNADWATNRAVTSVGSTGEQFTASELVTAVARGATVLHDLAVPLRDVTANIDHVLVSGNTITVLDSKHWTPGLYWTRAGTTRRWLTPAPKADKRSMQLAVNGLAGLLRRRNLPHVLADPITVVWSTGTIQLRWYRPPLGTAIGGYKIQQWLQELPIEPAAAGIVAALRPLVQKAR